MRTSVVWTFRLYSWGSVDFIIPISRHIFEQKCSISCQHRACSDHHPKVVFYTGNPLEVVSLHFYVSQCPNSVFTAAHSSSLSPIPPSAIRVPHPLRWEFGSFIFKISGYRWALPTPLVFDHFGQLAPQAEIFQGFSPFWAFPPPLVFDHFPNKGGG